MRSFSVGPVEKCDATEVKRAEYFGHGRRVRTDRTRVRYRVGQAFKHKKYGYKGVIVGWDEVPKAPASWFHQMGVAAEDQKKPMYAALVDVRDRDPEHSQTYVNEANVELISSPDDAADFQHPKLGRYFTSFHKRMTVFSANAALRKRYPAD